MVVNARLVALGVLLLFLSSGLLFETAVSDALALSVAGVAVAGTALAALVAVRTDAVDRRPT